MRCLIQASKGFYFLEAPSERLEAPSQLEAPLEAPFRGRPGPPWSPDDGRSPRHEGRHPPPKDPPDPLFLLIYPWVTARTAPLPPLPAARGFVLREAAFFDFLRSGGCFQVARMGKDGAAASLGYGTIRPHMCSPYAASVHTVVQTFVIHRSASPVRVRQRLLPLLHHCCGPARRGEPCPTAIATATSAVAIATITTTLPRCRRAFPAIVADATVAVSHVTSLAQRTAHSRVVRVLTSTAGLRLCTPQGTAEL